MNKDLNYKQYKKLCFPYFLGLAIFVGLLSLAATSSAKVVHIKVDRAQDLGIKIAVLPGDQLNNLSGRNELTEIIKIIAADLEYTGQFKTLQLNQEMLAAAAAQLQELKAHIVDFRFWRNTGVEYILTINLYPSKNADRLIMNILLVDLYKPLDPISLNSEFFKAPNESSRHLAHKISDLVFQKLIGIKSVFKTKIAYIKTKGLGTAKPEFNLNIADFDGFNEHTLLTANYPIMSPNWSPDGKKICFVSFKGNRSSIKAANLSTGRIEAVTQYPGINGAPAWAPDGERLAVVLSKDGNPAIYILDLVARSLQRFTHGNAIDTEPYWSKDSNEIYFTSNREGKPQIYKGSLFSGKIERVTFNGDYNTTPNITADGKYLITLHCSENCNKSNANFNIAVQALDTGKFKFLTKSGVEDSPSLAPNGMMVVYSTKAAGANSSRVLAVGSKEGNFNKYLPIINYENGSLKNPAWSPFLE